MFCVTLKPQWDGQRKNCSFLLRRKKEYCCLSTNCVWPWNLNEAAKERVALFLASQEKGILLFVNKLCVTLKPQSGGQRKSCSFFCFAKKGILLFVNRLYVTLKPQWGGQRKSYSFLASQETGILLFVNKLCVTLKPQSGGQRKSCSFFFCFARKRNIVVCQKIVSRK
jgi:hypothetical protein